MEELELANILYNYCLDMDYADYIEYADQEIQNLADEIKTAKEMNLDSLIYVLEIVGLQNCNLKSGHKERK